MIKRLERQADVNKIIEQVGESEINLREMIKGYVFHKVPEELRKAQIYLADTKQSLIKYLGEEQ